jgi:glycosyltransferase involved in cell wall biosynthesis
VDPLISVIIPTYGRPEFLAEAVRSVANQTYPHVEIIVVDDCSSPPVDVPGNCRGVRHARNMGPGAARNTGLAHATGELVMFLDDDDLLTPDRLRWAAEQIGERRAHAAAAVLKVSPHHAEPYGNDRFEGDMRAVFHQTAHPQFGQVVLRREDVVQLDPALRTSEDEEWWLRMGHAADFAWTDEIGLHVRNRDYGRQRPTVDDGSRYLTRLYVLRRHDGHIDRRSRARLRREVASAALLAGKRSQAFKWSAASLIAHPSMVAAKALVRSLLR